MPEEKPNPETSASNQQETSAPTGPPVPRPGQQSISGSGGVVSPGPPNEDVAVLRFQNKLLAAQSAQAAPPRKQEREKNPRRERLKSYVKRMREARLTHRQMCERLDEKPDKYPSPWRPKTWKQMYSDHRGTVDSYLSDLK